MPKAAQPDSKDSSLSKPCLFFHSRRDDIMGALMIAGALGAGVYGLNRWSEAQEKEHARMAAVMRENRQAAREIMTEAYQTGDCSNNMCSVDIGSLLAAKNLISPVDGALIVDETARTVGTLRETEDLFQGAHPGLSIKMPLLREDMMVTDGQLLFKVWGRGK